MLQYKRCCFLCVESTCSLSKLGNLLLVPQTEIAKNGVTVKKEARVCKSPSRALPEARAGVTRSASGPLRHRD